MERQNPYKISQLITKEYFNELNLEEKYLFGEWLAKSEENRKLYTQITNTETIHKKYEEYSKIDMAGAFQKVQQKIRKDQTKPIRKVMSSLAKYAAVIILPVIFGILHYNHQVEKSQLAYLSNNQTDVPPGSRKAWLFLTDGSNIMLEDENFHSLIESDGTVLSNTEKTLQYNSGSKETENKKEIAYNTLVTPRGGEYSLILADGSKVWLNAESKLKYPVNFSGKSRDVYLEGEAFFEVAKNTSVPFIVHTQEMNIKVLGTTFNIRTYQDDETATTTLVTGQVEVFDAGNNSPHTLTPGHQARFSRDTEKITIERVNPALYTSWKEGKFMFEYESLESIMQNLSRWYDVDIFYLNQDAKKYHFSGTIQRYENISKILNMIELTTDVKFIINEKEITVMEI